MTEMMLVPMANFIVWATDYSIYDYSTYNELDSPPPDYFIQCESENSQARSQADSRKA